MFVAISGHCTKTSNVVDRSEVPEASGTAGQGISANSSWCPPQMLALLRHSRQHQPCRPSQLSHAIQQLAALLPDLQAHSSCIAGSSASAADPADASTQGSAAAGSPAQHASQERTAPCSSSSQLCTAEHSLHSVPAPVEELGPFSPHSDLITSQAPVCPPLDSCMSSYGASIGTLQRLPCSRGQGSLDDGFGEAHAERQQRPAAPFWPSAIRGSCHHVRWQACYGLQAQLSNTWGPRLCHLSSTPLQHARGMATVRKPSQAQRQAQRDMQVCRPACIGRILGLWVR